MVLYASIVAIHLLFSCPLYCMEKNKVELLAHAHKSKNDNQVREILTAMPVVTIPNPVPPQDKETYQKFFHTLHSIYQDAIKSDESTGLVAYKKSPQFFHQAIWHATPHVRIVKPTQNSDLPNQDVLPIAELDMLQYAIHHRNLNYMNTFFHLLGTSLADSKKHLPIRPCVVETQVSCANSSTPSNKDFNITFIGKNTSLPAPLIYAIESSLRKALLEKSYEWVKTFYHNIKNDVYHTDNTYCGFYANPLLVDCVRWEDLDGIKFLIANNIEKDYIPSALLMAAQKGNTEILQFLLAQNPSQNIHAIALQIAVAKNKIPSAQILLGSGVNIDEAVGRQLCFSEYLAKTPLIHYKTSPITLAALRLHVPMVQFLLHKGARIDDVSTNAKNNTVQKNVLEMVLDHDYSTEDDSDNPEETAKFQSKKKNMINFLLANGALVSEEESLDTALEDACEYNIPELLHVALDNKQWIFNEDQINNAIKISTLKSPELVPLLEAYNAKYKPQ